MKEIRNHREDTGDILENCREENDSVIVGGVRILLHSSSNPLLGGLSSLKSGVTIES